MNNNTIALTIIGTTLFALGLFVAAKAYQLSLPDPYASPIADYSTWLLFAFFGLWITTVVSTLRFRQSFSRGAAIFCWSVVTLPGLFVLCFVAGLFTFLFP